MDLQTLFSTVCNMTITGSVVIGCVLAARLLLKKAPKGFACILWAVVLFRLLCPVSVSGPVSVLSVVDAPRAEAPVSTVVYVQSPAQMPIVHNPAAPAPSVTVEEPTVDWHLLASRLWIGGAAVLIAYGILSYVNLKRKLRESVPMGPGLREADGIRSPFLLGLLRPVIYLPSGLGEAERSHILLHERCHLRHGDHLVKAAFWLAVCIHWFNPLAWLAFVLCGRDMEMRCDEAVLRSLGPDVRSDYAQSLLTFAAGRSMAPASLAFGEGDTGKRVRHVLKWKKKAVWVLIPAAILCAVVLVLTACNPGGSPSNESPFGHSYKATTVVPTRYDEPVEQEQLYTLTSDMALFIRDGQDTSMRGSFKKLERLPASCAAFENAAEWALMKTEIANAWEAVQSGPDNYLLLQTEDGVLYLIQGETRYLLERTDLLSVTIRQSGMESYVEPVWCLSENDQWLAEDLPCVAVDGEAQIILRAQKDVSTILVEETYYAAAEPGTYGGLGVHTHKLDRRLDGTFVLTVTRRGRVGDDDAVYRVTVGEDHYRFLLTFPKEPGASVREEQTREVTFEADNAFLTLRLPESWEYTVTTLDDDAYSAGITFWPSGRSEGRLRFDYYPSRFGVCGTGLKTETMTLAGRTVTVGTYDSNSLWSYICFDEHFAVWGENHESWWAEYGEEAMAILNSATFGTKQSD